MHRGQPLQAARPHSPGSAAGELPLFPSVPLGARAPSVRSLITDFR